MSGRSSSAATLPTGIVVRAPQRSCAGRLAKGAHAHLFPPLKDLTLQHHKIRTLAAAFTLVATLHAQSECTGEQYFFDDSWMNGSYTVNGETPQWFFPDFTSAWDVACVQDQSGIPAIWHNSCSVECRQMQFFAKGRGGPDDNDSLGFVLGFCEGEQNDPNADYLAVIWNKDEVTAQLPGCAGPGTHPRGMRLVRVFGIPDPQELWSQTNLDLPCSDLNNGVEVLATANTLGDTGWTRFMPHGFWVEFREDNLKVWVDGNLEFDRDGDYTPYSGPDNCFGYFAQGQMVDFWGLEQYALEGVPASWNNYGTGTPGCDGVPELTMLNLPFIGGNPEIFIGNAGNTQKTGAMVWALAPANQFEPFLGGNLLVMPPFAAVTTQIVDPGGFTFACQIDDGSCQNGVEFYVQFICIDSCGPNGWALSRGLKIVLGDL